jgi:hypothetical protein
MIQAYLTFIRKSSSEKTEYNLLGLNAIENLDILCDFKLFSGQPIVCCISSKRIISVYKISSNGELNQIFGTIDHLMNIETINDISLKYIKNYNAIKHFLNYSFKCMSPDEIIENFNKLSNLEEKCISNLISSEVNWQIIKRNLSKEVRKSDLNIHVKSRILSSFNKLMQLNKTYLNKKIDVDLDGYDVKITAYVP